MEIAFDVIGLDIQNKTNLAKDVEKRGEVSRLTHKGGILYGHCWRIGEGLEVWTVLYQSETGECIQTDCRPGFRARFHHLINPWVIRELDEVGETMVHGFIEDTETEVLFKLQNITEVSNKNFQKNTLRVGLCGLAFEANILSEKQERYWKSKNQKENVWSLCGEIIALKTLCNPISGSNLYWLYLDLGDLGLEVLVNQKTLQGQELNVGTNISATVWLQGHLISESTMYSRYEGIDFRHRTVEFWKKFKRTN